MNKDQLIRELEEMGELLEIDGANAFKSGAYPKAARTLQEYRDELDVYIAENRLTKIPGIGKGLEQKILEFAETGTIPELEELRAKYPAGVLEISRIPGMGAKKTRQLFEDLDIRSIDDLKRACENNALVELKGFGAKSAAKILEGIDKYERYAGHHRLNDALRAATPILSRLREYPAVIQADLAGSLRRWREIVSDLDFVVATDSPTDVMKFFTGMEEVKSIIAEGETKSSIFLQSGIQADIRCVAPLDYPYALLHFTGSKEHNTELRALAKTMGLKLNEYGLFRGEEESPLAAKSEEDVYKHLELSYIPPEMREGMREVETAAKDSLPQLVTESDIVGIVHMHTHYSDGKPTVEEYARYAEAHNIEWMGITDHSQSLSIARGLSEERVLEQHAEIDAVNRLYAKKKVRLLKGIESDILESGELDYREEFLKNFEFIVSSVHTYFNLTEKEQTTRVRRALENPHTTILGHMTGRLLLMRDGFRIDQKEIIRAAAKNGVSIEINGNPRRLDVDWRLLRYAVEQGVTIALSPDAHIMEGLEDTRYALAMARKGWLTKDNILNCRPVEEFLAFARSRFA